MSRIPALLRSEKHVDTPAGEIVEFIDEVCGLYFRSYLIPKAMTLIPQHEHDYDHATLCGQGSAALMVEGVRIRDVKAGEVAEIKAGRQHAFITLEDNTRLVCIHDVESAMSIKERNL